MHRRPLDRELDRLLDLEPTDVEGSHLRATIAVTVRDKLLVFLTRRDVEATNNESERALRPSVIFRRVTNGFPSEWGARPSSATLSQIPRPSQRPIRWIGVSNYPTGGLRCRRRHRQKVSFPRQSPRTFQSQAGTGLL
jgi:hypothetical protein